MNRTRALVTVRTVAIGSAAGLALSMMATTMMAAAVERPAIGATLVAAAPMTAPMKDPVIPPEFAKAADAARNQVLAKRKSELARFATAASRTQSAALKADAALFRATVQRTAARELASEWARANPNAPLPSAYSPTFKAAQADYVRALAIARQASANARAAAVAFEKRWQQVAAEANQAAFDAAALAGPKPSM
jgi:hypothetical protein